MNLTSKRMLPFLTACASVLALSASAQTTWVSDNFEAEGEGYAEHAADEHHAGHKDARIAARFRRVLVAYHRHLRLPIISCRQRRT